MNRQKFSGRIIPIGNGADESRYQRMKVGITLGIRQDSEIQRVQVNADGRESGTRILGLFVRLGSRIAHHPVIDAYGLFTDVSGWVTAVSALTAFGSTMSSRTESIRD